MKSAPAVCDRCGSSFTVGPATTWVEWMAGYTIVGRSPEVDLRPTRVTVAACNGCENVVKL